MKLSAPSLTPEAVAVALAAIAEGFRAGNSVLSSALLKLTEEVGEVVNAFVGM